MHNSEDKLVLRNLLENNLCSKIGLQLKTLPTHLSLMQIPYVVIFRTRKYRNRDVTGMREGAIFVTLRDKRGGGKWYKNCLTLRDVIFEQPLRTQRRFPYSISFSQA